jgi:hypothetical protein
MVLFLKKMAVSPDFCPNHGFAPREFCRKIFVFLQCTIRAENFTTASHTYTKHSLKKLQKIILRKSPNHIFKFYRICAETVSINKSASKKLNYPKFEKFYVFSIPNRLGLCKNIDFFILVRHLFRAPNSNFRRNCKCLTWGFLVLLSRFQSETWCCCQQQTCSVAPTAQLLRWHHFAFLRKFLRKSCFYVLPVGFVVFYVFL